MNIIDSYRDKELNFHYAIDKNPRENYLMHAHEEYELFYFVSGRGRYVIEGVEYPLESGCLLIMRPSEVHKLYLDPAVPYERVVIEFFDSVIRPIDPQGLLLKAYHDRPLGRRNKYNQQNLIHGISDAVSDVCTSGLAPETKRINIIANIFAILNQIYISSEKSAGRTEFSASNTDLTRELIEYINAHLAENLSLQRLSEQFFFSQSHLGRVFKAATGSTIAEYILTKRLLEAHRRIRSGAQATKAAASCGFSDYSTFYRAFKKKFKYSPTDKR